MKNIKGPKVLIEKKIFLMFISNIKKNFTVYSYPNGDEVGVPKIFSKFVSIQNQIDKIKNIFI